MSALSLATNCGTMGSSEFQATETSGLPNVASPHRCHSPQNLDHLPIEWPVPAGAVLKIILPMHRPRRISSNNTYSFKSLEVPVASSLYERGTGERISPCQALTSMCYAKKSLWTKYSTDLTFSRQAERNCNFTGLVPFTDRHRLELDSFQST